MSSPLVDLHHQLGTLEIEVSRPVPEVMEPSHVAKDWLSSLSPEILHIVFDYLHVAIPYPLRCSPNLIDPISRLLLVYQQLNLFNQIQISRSMLPRLVATLSANVALGSLIRSILVLEEPGAEIRQEAHGKQGNAMEELIPFIAGINSLECWSSRYSDLSFLPRMNYFTMLKMVKLHCSNSNLCHLLDAPQLDRVHIITQYLLPWYEHHPEPAPISDSVVKRKNFTEFKFEGDSSAPAAIEFFRLIAADRFCLTDNFNIIPALSAIDPATTRLHLTATAQTQGEADYLNNSLKQFQLQHLELVGAGLPISDSSFFTTLLASSTITSLTLGAGFPLEADDLISTLNDEALSIGLVKITLDNIEVDLESEWETDEPGWTRGCTFEKAQQLISVLQDRGIKIEGTIHAAIKCQMNYDEYIEHEERDFEGISTCAFYSDRYA